MIYLFDNKLNLMDVVGIEDVRQSTQTLELKGLISAEAVIKYSPEFENAAFFGQKDESNFSIFKIRNAVKNNDELELRGIHIFFDDLKGKIIRDIRPKNVTASYVFSRILSGTSWNVGVTDTTTVASTSFYHKSVLEAFSEALDTWNVEYAPRIKFSDGKIISKTIDIKDKISSDYGKWFEYGDSLTEVVSEKSLDVYTAYIGMGKGEEKTDENGNATGGYGRKIKFDDIEWLKSKGNPIDKPKGQDYVEIKEATELFGYPDGTPRVGIVNFEDITDREELIKQTYEYALENCRPKVQLKSKAFSDNTIELGEVCAVIRPDLNIRYKTRVFKIKKDFLNPGTVEFEFGDKIIKSTIDRIRDEKNADAKKEKELDSRLSQILDEVSASYFNEDGYNYELKIGNSYKLPAGYYSFDRSIDNNPTKVVYMGAGKLLIANSKKPTGEWNWRTALTADGIAGEEIITNSITADKLTSDVGRSLDISSNKALNLFVNKDKLISEINLNHEGVRISGKNLQLDGNTSISGSFRVKGSTVQLDGSTQVNGDFRVSGNSLFGEINAQSINVRNLNANNITSGSLQRPYEYGRMSNSAYDFNMHGNSVSFTGNSSYIAIRDTGGRGEVRVNGTIAAVGSGYFYELNAGGLHLDNYGGAAVQTTGGRVLIKPSIQTPTLYIMGPRGGYVRVVCNTDNAGIHYE